MNEIKVNKQFISDITVVEYDMVTQEMQCDCADCMDCDIHVAL